MESTIYVAPYGQDSHITTWLVAEKEAPIRIKTVPRQGIKPAEPPYYMDDDVLVSEHYTLIQFLQERYPGEQLMPHDPIARAQMRQVCHDIREGEDLWPQFEAILRTGTPYLAGREFSIVDIYAGAWMTQRSIEAVVTKEVLTYYNRLRARPGYDQVSS